MPLPAYVTASAGSTDATGGSHTSAAPGAAGRLLIVHLYQDGTQTGGNAPSITSVTNAENLAGTDNVLTYSGPYAVGSATAGYQHLWFGRSLSTSAMAITGANAGGDDVYVRVYEFSGVHAGTSINDVVENSTAGTINSDANTSTTVADVSVVTTAPNRLALNFVAISDDAMGLAAFAGESGGDWTLAVAIYETSTGTDGCIGLMQASIVAPGTINGGTDTITSMGWGVVGFALCGPTTTKAGFGKESAS